MKIVVIGHGMVGHCFLQALAETGLSGAQVTVLCEEPRAAYDRVHLSEFFAGKSADDLSLVAPGFYALAGFVGAGLVFAGLTGFCGMARVLGAMPWNRQGA